MKSTCTLLLLIFTMYPSLSMGNETHIIAENDGQVIIETESGQTMIYSTEGVNTPLGEDQNTVAHQIIKHGSDKTRLSPEMNLSKQNKKGETPFTFWLIYNGNPENMDTLEFIYEKNPEAIYLRTIHGKTSLLVGLEHTNPIEVIHFIYSLHPQALFIPDNEGNLPLHYALQYANSSEVIRFIYKKNPSAFETPNKKGETPLDYAVKYRDNINVDLVMHILNPKAPRTPSHREETLANHAPHNNTAEKISPAKPSKRNGSPRTNRRPHHCQRSFLHNPR